jgi:diguanylate cyclase (GGDEF)-like protein/PAS domain S-box-containing protein
MPHPSIATVMDLLLDAVCVVDEEGRYVYVNAGYERIFGYRAEEVLGRRMIELVHPDDRERTLGAARNIMSGRPHLHFQNRYVRKDGRVVDIMWSAHWSPEQRVRIAVARDVTELKRAEAVQAALLEISQAAHAAEDLDALCARIHAVVGRLLPATNCRVALYEAESGQLNFPYFVDERMTAPDMLTLDEAPRLGEVMRTGQALLINPGNAAQLPARLGVPGGLDAADWLGVPLQSAHGTFGVLVVQSYDGEVRYSERDKLLLQFVSDQIAHAIERKRAQSRLQYLASHDPLTGLSNRGHLRELLALALDGTGAGNERLALLYLDLDGFKEINDNHGHEAGDRVLCDVAQRIRQCVRRSDTVARLGGDEFVVLLPGAEEADAQALATAIGKAVRRPLVMGGISLSIGVSVGFSLYPDHGTDAHTLLRHADREMYRIKQREGSRCAPVVPGPEG